MAQSITVNGNTYNDSPYDASTNPSGLANGGWRVNSKFITMLLDTLVDATTTMRTTSVTSLTIGTGSIGPLTLDQDVPFTAGDFVLISDTVAPTTNWMVGQITNRTDDDITVNVTKIAGTGTLSSWTVHLSAPPGEIGATGPAGTNGTNGIDGTDYWSATTFANFAVTPYTAAHKDRVLTDTSGGAITVTLPASPSSGDRVLVQDVSGDAATNTLTIGRNGQTIDGDAADFTINVNYFGTGLEFDGTTWRFFA